MDILLTGILVLLYTLQSCFCKLYTMTTKHEEASTPVFNAIFGSVIGVVTLFLYGFSFHPSPVTWCLGIANALLLFLYNTSLIGAARSGSYAFLNIVSLFGCILVPMLSSMLLFEDRLTGWQLAAVALMLLSFVVMNGRGLTLSGTRGKYMVFCILLFFSNGFFAAILDVQQRLSAGAERGEMVMISYLGTMLLSVLYVAVTQKRKFVTSFSVGGKAFLFALSSGAVAVAAVNLLLYLLNQISATVLYSINNGGVLLLSVLFAAGFLREKLSGMQILGILGAIVSIVILSL